MTIIIQAVESGGRSGRRKFPAIGFAGIKSPDLAFSNVDRYDILGPWPRPFLPLASTGSVLEKSVLGLCLAFFFDFSASNSGHRLHL